MVANNAGGYALQTSDRRCLILAKGIAKLLGLGAWIHITSLPYPLPELNVTKRIPPSLAELVRLCGGRGFKSVDYVSKRSTFLGNKTCLPNFRESANGRWPCDFVPTRLPKAQNALGVRP